MRRLRARVLAAGGTRKKRVGVAGGDVLHPNIDYKNPSFQYDLDQEGGFLSVSGPGRWFLVRECVIACVVVRDCGAVWWPVHCDVESAVYADGGTCGGFLWGLLMVR